LQLMLVRFIADSFLEIFLNNSFAVL
jgi:hypothetical protein